MIRCGLPGVYRRVRSLAARILFTSHPALQGGLLDEWLLACMHGMDRWMGHEWTIT